MSIDLHYIPLFTLEEVFLDKDTALPMAGGVVTFYKDLQRQTPKSVFMISGNPPDYTFTDLGNELTLGISGTFVDENGDPFVPYAYPFDSEGNVELYYVTVENSGSIAQFTREAVPYVNTQNTPATEAGNDENQLANPQFVEVDIPSVGAVTLNVTGTNTVTPIAPGWDFVTTGTGTIIVERLQPTASQIPTNPPYILSIQASSSLGSSITLRQRLTNTTAIFRGGFATASFTAAVLGGGASNISLVYAPSSGSSTTIIPSTAIPTDGAYHTVVDNAAIPQQTNTAADSAYVDVNIIIPASRTIGITSLQLAGVATATNLGFDEQTADRQKDHLFHYYEDAAVRQSKGNLLAGWTFGINPWQFYATNHGNVATNEYTADQTIVIQQNYVATATGNNVSVNQGSVAQKHGFLVAAVTAANKFALLQYIDASTIRPYWEQKLSVMVRASAVLAGGKTTVPRFKVRLMYRAGVPLTVAQTNPVSGWNDVADDIPALVGWTYITALNDPTYTLTTTVQNFNFDGFQLPATTDANMTLGIMIIMMNDIDQTGTPDKILFEKVSLVHSDFAVDASPETFDEGLRKCQFYYEKSFPLGSSPFPSTLTGVQVMSSPVITDGSTLACYRKTIQVFFKQTKRTSPTMQFYGTNAVADQVTTQVLDAGGGVIQVDTNRSFSGGWAVTQNSADSVFYHSTDISAIFSTASAVLTDELLIKYHYTADARLGT